jgi:hypothetical protein
MPAELLGFELDAARRELPFDEVRLLAPPPERRIDAAAFFTLPLAQRLRHVLAKTAIFLKGGAEVDARLALAEIRSTRLAG